MAATKGGIRRRRLGLVTVAVALGLALGACTTAPGTASAPSSGSRPGTTGRTGTTVAAPRSDPAPTGGPTSGPTTPRSAAALPSGSTRDVLAPLRIEDRAAAPTGYRRAEWPHWLDVDGDGCDARSQALRDASDPPAVLGPRCKVLSGSWVSAYDGLRTDKPGDLDVDHVVPLENAYISGGDTWSTDRRTQYANDQADLWVVSAGSNRSKGARSPDQWRPPERAVWCTYARRWVAIKVRWDLTATTSERDALGQMLDTCPA